MKTLVSMAALLMLASCTCNPPCDAGALDCACKEAQACNDALVCSADNKCIAPTMATVRVTDAAARGCELVLNEAAGTTVAAVAFNNGVEGTWVRQAPKVAVTFVAGGDSAVSGQVELGLTGPASGVTVSKTGCVDVRGQRIAGVGASVQ